MKGILAGNTAKTNEEYKNVIKYRMKIIVVLLIIGIITVAVGFGAELYMKTSASENIHEVFSAAGIDLIIISSILWIKNRLLLNDEVKLKKNRLNNTDERIHEIGNKSFKLAAIVMLIVSYATALIGGLFDPLLAQVLLFIPCIFLIAYIIAFKYYNNKMW